MDGTCTGDHNVAPRPALSPRPAADDPSFVRALPSILVLALAMAIGFTMMGSFSTVQEGAKAEMQISDFALGLVQGLSIALPLLFLSIPIGVAVDRGNRVRLLIGLSVAWTTGTLLTALAGSVPILFVARMVTATGTAGALTTALSLTADLCAPEQRGRATLVVTLGQRVGIAAAIALAGWLYGLCVHGAAGGWLVGIAPWRGAHILLAIIGAALIVPLLFLREPARREAVAGPSAPFRIVAGELWARRAFLVPLFAGQVSVVMADAAAGIWAAPVLSRDYGLHPEQFAGWLGLLLFVAGIAGSVIGGVSADLGHKSGRRGLILLGAVIAAGLGIPAALFPIVPGVVGFAVALGLLILCGTITGIVVAVALTVLIPNELRGLCIGTFISIAGLIGFGIAPTLVTLVSGLLGGDAQLAPALAIVGVCVSALSFLAFLFAMQKAPAGAVLEPI